MTSIQDKQSPVNALHNQTCTLYHQLLTHIGPSTPEGQAEQNTMSNFFGIVERLMKQPQAQVFKNNLKIQYLTK